MTDNKLTLQDCFKYPFAKIVRFDLVLGVKIDTFYSIQDFIEESARYALISDKEISNCKLIRRDISELTDEEMEKISNDYLFVKCYSVKLFNELFGIISVGKLINYIANKENLLLPLFDYLRSINIDIDGFIKSGKAVKG